MRRRKPKINGGRKAKSVGKKIKSAVQDEQVVGGNGSVKANVEVVESQGVEEQSAIRGTQNVDLTVKGKTDLVGGKISSKIRMLS